MDLPDAHFGIQVQDLTEACGLLTELFGITFAEPISGWPIRVRVGEEIEHSQGTFTVSREGPPFLEVTGNVAGSQVWHSDGRPLAFHHPGGLRTLGHERKGGRRLSRVRTALSRVAAVGGAAMTGDGRRWRPPSTR